MQHHPDHKHGCPVSNVYRLDQLASDLLSCTQAFLLAACTLLKKTALQLLWDMTPDLCKTVYA